MNIKSAFASKINWTQAIAAIAMILTMFGFNLPADVQAQIVAIIVGVQAVVTWVMRTWFTTSITPQSAAKLN